MDQSAGSIHFFAVRAHRSGVFSLPYRAAGEPRDQEGRHIQAVPLKTWYFDVAQTSAYLCV